MSIAKIKTKGHFTSLMMTVQPLGARTCPLNREGFKKNSLRLKNPEYDENPFLKYKGKAMNKNTKIEKDDFIYISLTY